MMLINLLSLNGNRYWFWEASFFSDWSNSQSDYATNAVVHNFYNEKKAKWYRANKYQKFAKLDNYYIPEEVAYKLLKGDTLIIGLDKYALMGVSSSLIPPKILEKSAERLFNEKVVRFRIFMRNSFLIWEEKSL